MSAPDLLSLVLTLRPLGLDSNRPLPVWWGQAAHAALLRVIQLADPGLSARLHDDDGLKPFTASSLMGRPAPGRESTLRFTAVTGEVSALLLDAAQNGPLAPGARLELDYIPFEITAAAWNKAAHPWAGTESYAGLAETRLLGNQPPRRFTLQFASPTAFRSGGMHQPLPLPDLVFGSLLERWNRFAPAALPEEARRYAAECLAISRFELRSRSVPLKGSGLRVGAAGLATYASLNADRYWLSLMHALAAYALFAGVGAGAGLGFGQCRCLPAVE